ncbi:MAG: hypothetical protein PW734_04265 [Verrucomicrobium sp.]|nr:hypothetical protein [Verrucomicrobium sp.]
MRTRLNRLQYFLLLSLLVHLVTAFVWTDPNIRRLLLLVRPKPITPPAPPSLALTLNPSSFVPTLPSQAADKPDPRTVLESDRNTLLKSGAPPKDPNSSLPSMAGAHRGGLVYHDSPNSPQIRSQESEAAPATQAQPTPAAPKAAPQPTKTPPQPQAQPAGAKSAPDVPPSPDAVPLFPAPNDAKTKAEKETPQPATPPQPQVQPAVQSPPPSSASFSQQRSEVVGGGALGDPSPASKETEMGRYKAKLYRMIGSRWYLSVERNMTLLAIGEVHIKFYVQANGVISNVSVSAESGRVDILRSISLKAVAESYGEPFTDNLKQQLGDGFWDDITFTIY